MPGEPLFNEGHWPVRLVTLVFAALAAGSINYWALKWPSSPKTLAVPVVPPSVPQIATEQITKLFDPLPAASQPTSSPTVAYKLLGVIVEGDRGSALIAVDRTNPKPYHVGQRISDAWILHSVTKNAATLVSNQDPATRLDLPMTAASKPAK